MSPSLKRPPLPPETRWLLAFQVFNALNFTLALGAPLILTARFVGASEAMVGLLTTLMPLLVILQLFATRAIDRYGCRRMMISGWGLRAFFLLIIAPVPMLVGTWSTQVLIWMMFIGMFGFNATRGFTGAAWFPWLTAILPENQRGQFLGTEQRCVNTSAFLTLILCGLFLGAEPAAWQYTTIFLVSWIAGMISAALLYRVPEQGTGRRDDRPPFSFKLLRRSFARIWSHEPLRRMTQFNALFSFAVTAQPVFLVLYLREQMEFGEGMILKLQAGANLGVLLTSVYWGRLSDRVGSRPLLRIFDLGIFSVFAYWMLGAFGLYVPTVSAAFLVFFVGGIFSSAHGVSMSRLMLGCSPREETTFSLAFFTVVSSVSGGMAPVLFGLLLVRLRGDAGAASGALSLPYAWLFLAFVALGLGSWYLIGRLPETGRMPTRQVIAQVVYGWPTRVLSGIVAGGRIGRRRDD